MKIRLSSKIFPAVLAMSLVAPAQAAQLMEEIVVTAQKREQAATDVPMAITALSGEDLTTLGLTDTRDLALLVPGLNYSVSPQQTPVYTMRGIGFNTYNFTSTSPVGVYYDEFASPYPYAGKGMAFDIDRLEVLKGPQGTLYGRNTTGGLVNYISNRPAEEFEAGLTVGLGEFETTTAEGFVSGAVTETLGVRVAFAYEKSDEGWQKSVTRPGDELGKKDRHAVRFIADFHPNDDFEAQLTVNYWKDESDPYARQLIGAQAIPGISYGDLPWDIGTLSDSLITRDDADRADWYSPAFASPDANAWPAEFAPVPEFKNESDSTQINLRLDWHLSDSLTLTSLTHSGTVERDDVYDQSGMAHEYGVTNSFGEIDTFSQELRLSGSSADERLNFIVGLYYSKDDLFEEDPVWSETAASLRGLRLLTGTAIAPGLAMAFGLDAAATADLVNNAIGGFRTFSSVTEGDSKSRAIFGQIDYRITDDLELTIGARYTEDELNGAGCSRDALGDNNIQGVWNLIFVTVTGGLGPGSWAQRGECISFLDSSNFAAGLVDPTGHKVDLEEDSFSWRVALSWEPGDSAMFYGSISKGFKSGVIPLNASFTADQLQPVKQEEVLAYELGVKATPADWVHINASIYHYDYEDKQLFGNIIDPVFTTLRTLINVPESEVRGFEADVILYPSDNTLIKIGASFVDSEVTKFIAPDGDGINRDFSGSPFQQTPEWEYTFLLSHNFVLTDNLNLRASVDVSYRDDSIADMKASGVPEPMFNTIDSYTLVGARIALTPAEDNWEIAVFGRNLTDEYYSLFVAPMYPSDEIGSRMAGMVRTWGAEFTYRF